MSKYWKSLDIANHHAISDEVYDYVVNHTELLTGKKHYFTRQHISYMLYHCPLLFEFLKKHQLVPVFVGVILCSSRRELPMHKDHDGLTPWLRLLWPVRNCQGTKTKIWRVPDGAGINSVDSNNILFVNFPSNQERELIEEFELVSPVIFDASSPHSVESNPEIKDLRISLTIGFDQNLPISKSFKAWADFQD